MGPTRLRIFYCSTIRLRMFNNPSADAKHLFFHLNICICSQKFLRSKSGNGRLFTKTSYRAIDNKHEKKVYKGVH